MKFLNNLNMCQNEIQNAVIQNLADAPSNPRAGQLYWDSTNKKLYIYDGTKWGATAGDDKMDKVNPTGTGSFSLNRKADTTVGNYSFAEGYETTARGYSSHAEGNNAYASGYASHAEGGSTEASGDFSHAECVHTTASGDCSHAEGYSTTASGYASHAEGYNTTASGDCSHAEGRNTTTSGDSSHAEGNETTANHLAQHVFGEYNVLDTSTAAATERGNYIEIVGNGNASARSNARTLDWSGNEVLAGTLRASGLTDGTTTKTMTQVLDTVTAISSKITASNIKAGANIGVTTNGNDVTIKAVDVATLDSDGKVPLSQLPDAVLGQLVYGGNVTTGAVATLTDNAKKKLGTTSATITLTNNTTAITGYKANEGIYYIATTGFTFAGITFETGDWLISTGSAWTKVDTSDAVSGVKGDKETTYRRGNVNLTPANIGAEPSDSARLLTPLSSATNIWELSAPAAYIVTASSVTLTYYSAGSTKTYTLPKGTILTTRKNSTDTWPRTVTVLGDDASTNNALVSFVWYGKGTSGWDYRMHTYNYGLALNGTITNGEKLPFYAPTSAGTSGQVLSSTGGTPTWKTLTLLSKATATNAALTPSGGVCTWTIANSIGSADVSVDIYEVSTNEKVLANVVVTSSTITVTIASTADITTGAYKAVIIG